MRAVLKGAVSKEAVPKGAISVNRFIAARAAAVRRSGAAPGEEAGG